MRQQSFKSNFSNLFIPLIITLIFCIPIYGKGIHWGCDLVNHLTRIKGISEGIRSHTFPIYVYPYTNNGFGYAYPLFYCDLFLLFPSFLYLIGVPLIVSFKVLYFVIVLFTSYSSYYLFRYIYEDNVNLSLFSTILYCFSSVFIEYYINRESLGSMFATGIIPLLLLSFYKLFIEKKECPILLGLSFSLLLLSHNLSFLMAVVLFGLFLIIDIKNLNKSRLITIVKAMILALCITAFFLFPMIEQLLSQDFWIKFLNKNNNPYWLKESRTTVLGLLNDNILDYPKISSKYLGLLLIVGSIVGFVILVFKKLNNKITTVFFLFIIIGLILQWNIFPTQDLKVFNGLQYIWRINIYLMPLAIYIIGQSISYIRNKELSRILLVLMALYSLSNFGVACIDVFNLEDKDILLNDASYEEMLMEADGIINDTHFINEAEIGMGEYLPLTNSYNYKQASTNIIASNDDEIIFDYYRIGTSITFNTDFNYDINLYMPLSWYKGYYYQELDDNGSALYTKECGYSTYTKRVEVPVESGNHTYKVFYKGTIIKKVSLLISVVTVIYMCFYIKKRKAIY